MSTTTSTSTDVDLVMREIESKTEANLLKMQKSGAIVDPIIAMTGCAKKDQLNDSIKNLHNLMDKGAKEFEQKVGRPMTYAEMRSMYG